MTVTSIMRDLQEYMEELKYKMQCLSCDEQEYHDLVTEYKHVLHAYESLDGFQ